MNQSKLISNTNDYNAALQRIEFLIAQNPAEGSESFLELDQLAEAVSAYEDIHFPIETES